MEHYTGNKVFVSPAPRFLLLDGAATWAVFDRNLALVEEGNMVVKQSAYGGCRLSETRRTVSFDRRLKKETQG